MPEVSRFFGISIRMYFDDHNPPHFHAIYALAWTVSATCAWDGIGVGSHAPTRVARKLGASAK